MRNRTSSCSPEGRDQIMLITTSWLLQYLDGDVTHDALMEAFPRIGLEIEESEKLGDGYQPI